VYDPKIEYFLHAVITLSQLVYLQQKNRANPLFQHHQTFKSVQKIIFWAFSGRQDGGASQLLSNYKGDRITGLDSAQN
jgi:hypothetical protein